MAYAVCEVMEMEKELAEIEQYSRAMGFTMMDLGIIRP